MPRRSPHPSPEADLLDRDLGDAIRRFRTDLGLSQHALAARLSLSGQQLQKYESGANRVSASTLYRLARELDQPVSAFFPAQGGRDGLEALLDTPEGRALSRDFARIHDMGQRRAVGVIVEGLARPA
ncbi:MAG: helix-turn-helix domain-containing protein [Brevundimonas sp.]|uniref:helix-turn-helix domain-containing protein n=1 Tax=Brevundimonas sp. TaxID=1871086 RepID=UPI003918F430